jgi:hypothetical protein
LVDSSNKQQAGNGTELTFDKDLEAGAAAKEAKQSAPQKAPESITAKSDDSQAQTAVVKEYTL